MKLEAMLENMGTAELSHHGGCKYMNLIWTYRVRVTLMQIHGIIIKYIYLYMF